ncbi:hypothetical protein HHI36_016239 [Cryptolaemus montrouzieri]|uniref:Transferrin n=1 Tax=Cryptolaemus montrouzieri TaxID=559131 RepID=A0ABD2NJX6_9CUCU
MFVKIAFLISLICITLIHAGKFRICAVDGRGSFKRATRYCPALNTPDSQAQCVIGMDRLDCLRKISKKQADFAVFTPEDLIVASNSAIEALIINELRFSDVKYEYEVVAVLDKKAGIKSRHDLQDKRFCHPGYGYQSDWTTILSNYLEASIVPQMCQPELSLTENRIKSSSEFFKSACKAGPWVNNITLDFELKSKYPNLCESCDSPRKCSKDDKYWGRRGSLLCLTDGAGDVSWARWDDVQIHFGLVPGGRDASPEEYNLLCPDESVRPLNTTNPCVWVVKPWSVVASVRSKAQDIQAMISGLTSDDNNSWQTTLLKLIESYSLSVKTLNPVEPIETYLSQATGFLSANSFPGCHPPRTIHICTTSILESSKCSWLRETAASYGIQPSLECLKTDDNELCMDAVQKGFADVVIIKPDLLNRARSQYNLKTLFHETVNDDFKYLTIALTKKNADINSFEDMKGTKACFPVYDGVAWNSVAILLNEKNLLESCPTVTGMTQFFSGICTSELPKNESESYISPNCKTDVYSGDEGALRCLMDGVGDVAFLSKNTLKRFLSDKVKNNENLTMSDLKMICEESDADPCFLSWAPVGHAMVRENSSNLWIKDTLDVFFAADDLFGKNYKSPTTSFTMFGPFNGKNNLLFHDATVRIRSEPTARNVDKMPREYGGLLGNETNCRSSASVLKLQSAIFLLIFLVYLEN